MSRQREGSERRSDEPQRELLERFHEEHAALHHMLRSLRRRLREARASTGEGPESARARSEVASLLGQLAERLPRHFASEERAGFLSEAVNHAPRLSRRADALRAECAQLARGVAALRTRMRSAGRATRRWQELDAGCRRFAEAYHDHESRENDLICEAWVEDIGAVD